MADDDPFVISDTLSFELSPGAGDISGDIVCHGDVVVDVTKHFQIKQEGEQQRARTVRYSYHARYTNGDDILRYDNAHESADHSRINHKHEFGPEGEAITDIGPDWPHLSEVLEELKRMVWK